MLVGEFKPPGNDDTIISCMAHKRTAAIVDFSEMSKLMSKYHQSIGYDMVYGVPSMDAASFFLTFNFPFGKKNSEMSALQPCL